MPRFCLTRVLSDNYTVRVSTNTAQMIDRMKKAKEKYPEQIKIVVEEQPEEIWTADFPLGLAVYMLAHHPLEEE